MAAPDTSKLPKWAQEHIANLKRERNTAISKLNEVLDKQKESPFYFDEFVCTGESQGVTPKRVYVQTYKMGVLAHGIRLEVMLRPGDDWIDLSWEDVGRGMADVALVPVSFNKVKLISKEKMR
jgi:hypothetical protein